MAGEVENVPHGCRAKRIDRLRVVTDHGEALSVRFQRQQDRGLQAVRILVLVDQDVVEAPADVLRQSRIADGLRPVKQEVVVIENALPLLCFDIGREQLPEFRRPSRTPRKRLAQHLFDFGFRIDASGVDRKASAFGRKAAFGP